MFVCTQKYDFLLILGDLNSDFLRISSHVESVKVCFNELNLFSLWENFTVDFTYMFQKDNNAFTLSTIDHFVTLNKFGNKLVNAGVIHSVENLSDHELIYAVVKISREKVKQDTTDTVVDNIVVQKPIWKEASSDQKLEFNDIVFRYLCDLDVNEDLNVCENLNCTSSVHHNHIDKFAADLLGLVNDAAFQCIPVIKQKKKTTTFRKSTPGWKEFVEPMQDNAKFWYMVWLSAGKPENTELHRIMKSTRNKYHYQIRRCKRVEEYLRNCKMVQNGLENDVDLFNEVRKKRLVRNEDEVTIDGYNGNDIPEAFASVYSNLYNRTRDDQKVYDILTKVNGMLSETDMEEVQKISSFTIKEALSKIKPGKTDPIYQFSSDCLKNAPDIFHDYLAKLVKTFFIHGYIPKVLLTAVLVPIVKDKLGNVCDSKNYRSIAISSLVLKLIDWIIIDKYGHLMKTNDFQFGFQAFSSTSLCSWMVFETIDMYLRNGSIVYGCLLDCTKAFDTIEHSKLFQKLIDAQVPPVVIRILVHIYRKQTAKVRWKEMYSQEFPIRNGVRQGAVISPLFFSFYMDGLFSILSSSGSGCCIDRIYAGCFAYADNLFLISPSRKGLQDMLDLAAKYVADHNVTFSTNPDPLKSKTKGIIFSKKKVNFEPKPLRLNNDDLPWVNHAKYLGNEIVSMPDGLSKDAKAKRARYIERNVELNQEFKFAHPEVKCRINKIYNSAFPGSVLYDLKSNSASQLVNSWSVSIRQMWELPFNSHRYLVEQLGGDHAFSMLIMRFVNFIKNIQKSDKIGVQLMLRKVINNVDTVTGRNVRSIRDKIGKYCDLLSVNSRWLKNKLVFCTMNKEDDWKVNIIREVTNLNAYL